MTFEDDVRKWATLDTKLSDINNAAKELRNDLLLTYNKARQAAITNEILEIVGGAEDLNN